MCITYLRAFDYTIRYFLIKIKDVIYYRFVWKSDTLFYNVSFGILSGDTIRCFASSYSYRNKEYELLILVKLVKVCTYYVSLCNIVY